MDETTDTTEQPLLVIYRNRNRDTDTYALHPDSAKLLASPINLPSRVILGRDWPNPAELSESQRDALAEILTGLRDDALRAYSVEIWLWDDSLIEKWW